MKRQKRKKKIKAEIKAYNDEIKSSMEDLKADNLTPESARKITDGIQYYFRQIAILELILKFN